MGVRVKVRISTKGSLSVEANALLNTGFESDVPEVIVPTRVAEALDIWPRLPNGTAIKAFETAGGTIRMPLIREAVEIEVVTKDRVTKPVKCSLAISEVESEVLLSDRAIDEFGIIIISPGKGVWRFKGERRLRSSEEPQYW